MQGKSPQVNPVKSIFGGSFPSASHPQSMCTRASAHSTWAKAQRKTAMGVYMWMYTLTHIEAYTWMRTHLCAVTEIQPHAGDSSYPRAPPSWDSSTSQLQQQASQHSPHHPPWPGSRPSPVCPQLQLPWPSCILSRANPFVDSHFFHPSSSVPVTLAVSSGLLHPISYTLLAPCLLAYPWLVRGLCLEPCPLLLSDAHAPLRIL